MSTAGFEPAIPASAAADHALDRVVTEIGNSAFIRK